MPGLLSSKGSLGQALDKIRSCIFRPGRPWGRPVTVRMRLWVSW
jgi:hypothetical protein